MKKIMGDETFATNFGCATTFTAYLFAFNHYFIIFTRNL
jgi:hypothetical protein